VINGPCGLDGQGQVVSLFGIEKSGTTWVEYLLDGLVRGYCNETQECVVSGTLRTQNMKIYHPEIDCTWQLIVNVTIKHEVIPQSLPKNKKILYTFRDPRDMVVSAYYYLVAKKQGFSLTDFMVRAYRFDDTMRWMDSQFQRALSTGSFLVQYEETVKHPLLQLQRMSHFMGLNPSYEVLSSVVEQYSFENMAILEDSLNKSQSLTGLRKGGLRNSSMPRELSFKKVRRGKIGGYKDRMTTEDLEYANHTMELRLNSPLVDIYLEGKTFHLNSINPLSHFAVESNEADVGSTFVSARRMEKLIARNLEENTFVFDPKKTLKDGTENYFESTRKVQLGNAIERMELMQLQKHKLPELQRRQQLQ